MSFEPDKHTIENVRQCIRDAGGVPYVSDKLGLVDWAVRKWFNSGIVPVSSRGNRVKQLIELANNMTESNSKQLPLEFVKREWSPEDLRPDLFA